jgi:hypothetical protein
MMTTKWERRDKKRRKKRWGMRVRGRSLITALKEHALKQQRERKGDDEETSNRIGPRTSGPVSDRDCDIRR